MSWKIKGSYVETCSCDLICPCNASFDHGATYDYCRVTLVFNIKEGEIEGTDVGGDAVRTRSLRRRAPCTIGERAAAVTSAGCCCSSCCCIVIPFVEIYVIRPGREHGSACSMPSGCCSSSPWWACASCGSRAPAPGDASATTSPPARCPAPRSSTAGLIFLAGVLLIIPGYVSDACAACCCSCPPVRGGRARACCDVATRCR